MAELIPFIAVLAFLWFVLIRPQRRRRSAQLALQDRISPGDEVLTVGGVFGTVRSVSDDEVRLQIAPDTEIRVDRRAVARIVGAEETPSKSELPR